MPNLIYDAILSNDRSALKTHLLDTEMDTNTPLLQQGFQQDTPLFWAMYHKQKAMVITLLLNGADSNLEIIWPNGETKSLLYYLSERVSQNPKDSEAWSYIGLLINNGVNLSQPLHNGQNILHLAAMSANCASALSKFLDTVSKECFEQYDNLGNSPLIKALNCNNTIAFEMFIRVGVDCSSPNPFGFYPLYFAIKQNNQGFVKALIQKGADVNAHSVVSDAEQLMMHEMVFFSTSFVQSNLSPLLIAAHYADSSLLIFLLQSGANIHLCPRSGLLIIETAIKSGSLAKLAVILERYTEIPNDQEVSGLLRLTLASQSIPLISLVTRWMGKNNIRFGLQEMMNMIEQEVHNPKIRKVLQNNYQRNTFDNFYKSKHIKHQEKLELAIEEGNIQKVNVFLETVNDVNVCVSTQPHLSLLAYAVGKNSKPEIIESLLKAGANPDYIIKIEVPISLLSFTVGFLESYKITSLLLEYGANPNLFVEGEELKAIHYAVQCGHLGIISLLMDYGANPNILTKKLESRQLNDLSALEIAAHKGNAKVLDSLFSYPITKSYKEDKDIKNKIVIHFLNIFLMEFTQSIFGELNQTSTNILNSLCSKDKALKCLDVLIKYGYDFNQAEVLSSYTSQSPSPYSIHFYLMFDKNLQLLPKLLPHLDVQKFLQPSSDTNDEVLGLLDTNLPPIVYSLIGEMYPVIRYFLLTTKIDLNTTIVDYYQSQYRLLDIAMHLEDILFCKLLISMGANPHLHSLAYPEMSYGQWMMNSNLVAFKELAMELQKSLNEQYKYDFNHQHLLNSAPEVISTHRFVNQLEKLKSTKRKHKVSSTSTLQQQSIFLTQTPQIPEYTWFEGKLSTANEKLIRIDNADIPSYIYLDKDSLGEQGCEGLMIDQFANTRKCFDETHIKRIEGGIKNSTFSITHQGKTYYQAKFTHELKLKHTADRVLLCKVKGEGAHLYIGCLYLKKGLHTQAAEKNVLLMNKKIAIQFEETQSESLVCN